MKKKNYKPTPPNKIRHCGIKIMGDVKKKNE